MTSENIQMKKFTLVELIIIIAIIGILMTLLLPSLSKARIKAQIAVCLSNLRQNGVAFTTYAVNNNNSSPANTYNGIVTNTTFPAHGYVGIKTTLSNFKAKTLNEYLGIPGGTSEIPDMTVAKCPLDNYPQGGDQNYKSTFQRVGHSYMGNAREGGGSVGLSYDPSKGYKPVNILTINTSPSRMVVMQEHGAYHRAYGFPQQWSKSWHDGLTGSKFGLLFLDGSVKNLIINNNQSISTDFSFNRNQ